MQADKGDNKGDNLIVINGPNSHPSPQLPPSPEFHQYEPAHSPSPMDLDEDYDGMPNLLDVSDNKDDEEDSDHKDFDNDPGFISKDDETWVPDQADLESLTAGEKLGVEFNEEAIHAAQNLSEDELRNIKAFNYKVDINQPDSAYKKLHRAFPALEDLETVYRLQRHMAELWGEANRDLTTCIYCDEPRYKENGENRQAFEYIPLIPRVITLHRDAKFVKVSKYHANFVHNPNFSADVLDGAHYRQLLESYVSINGERLTHKHFSDLQDMGWMLSTDGFDLWKCKKYSCWPLILFNINLPPKVRFHIENIICIGTIPGPCQMKNMDLYLWPSVQEMYKGARGFRTYDAEKKEFFPLHLYLIIAFGDIPAIAKLMRMKGHNGECPCRMCSIKGFQAPNKCLYVPLYRTMGRQYDPLNLPLRNHNTLMRQAHLVQNSVDNVEENRWSQKFGIKGVPILSTLLSMSFPRSFPYDFMHMVWENVIKILIELWCGTKGGDI